MACSPAPRSRRRRLRRRSTAASPERPYDPCYHQPCDNLTGDGQDEALYDALSEDYDLIGNVNTFALDVNSDAVAAAIITFAFDTSTVNDVSAPGKSHGAGKSTEAMKNKFAE